MTGEYGLPRNSSLACAPMCCSIEIRSIASIARLNRSVRELMGSSTGVSDVALLFVAAHMQIAVVSAAQSEPVNQPWIAMKVEDDRP